MNSFLAISLVLNCVLTFHQPVCLQPVSVNIYYIFLLSNIIEICVDFYNIPW